MKGILIALLAVVLPALAVHADDQQAEDEAAESKPPCAFGFCMGQAINAKPDGNFVGVLFRNVEHGAFNGGVTVLWTGKTGVCEVHGYQNIAERNRTGAGWAHKREFARFAELVEGKHGSPTDKFDEIDPDSIWNEYDEWAIALEMGDATLAHYWTRNLRDGLDRIVVQAVTDRVEVHYEFANLRECIEQGRRSFADDF